MREINGYETATGELVSRLRRARGRRLDRVRLLDLLRRLRRQRQPGPPARPGRPLAPGGSVSPEWAWAWPANRRILYSRASADPDGKPWSERKKHVWWDGRAQWTGYDVPDFPVDKPPDYQPPPDAEGMDAIGGADPFIMMADGRAWLYAPSGLLDGPMPTHYEPIESPVDNLLYPEIHANPAALRWTRTRQPGGRARRPALPARGHDLPADRAPHGGRDVALAAVAGRAAAGDVRRDRPGARRARGDRGRRLDDDQLAARRDRGAGARDRPHAPAEDRPRDDPPDRPALALGLAAARSPATRPTT